MNLNHLRLKNPVLEILRQYKQLTRRRGPPHFYHLVILIDVFSGTLTIFGFYWLICGYIPMYDDTSMKVTGCVLFLGGILLLLGNKLLQKKLYNKWRMSFADEQMSTENQNHWFPQFSRYTHFSWCKELRQGPWDALKRRRDTGAAEIPLEPIQIHTDEPPRPSA